MARIPDDTAPRRSAGRPADPTIRAGRGRRRLCGLAPAPVIAVVMAAALAACAVPAADDQIATPADGETPRVLGTRGPLTAAESQAVLARLAENTADATLLQRHAAIEQAVADTELVAGNRTRVLRDGPDSFRAIFAAIRSARDHVNLEYYILEDVESDGARLGDLLAAKLGQGVAVNIIYDSYGSIETPVEFFDRLRDAGAAVIAYNPINPLEAGEGYAPNARTHRKILVADGRRAVIGGVNLSADYSSRAPGLSSLPEAPEGEPRYHWRDTALELDGPIVAQIQTVFLEHWEVQGGRGLGELALFPEIKAESDEVVRIIGSSPDQGLPNYYLTLLSAIRTAEKNVWLTAAYFVPTEQALDDLEEAAERGIDVRLLLPGVSDSEDAINVAQSHYGDLLEAGVKIWEAHDVILHAKTATVDGVWSVIGSSNFDHRSVLFNDEIDAVVLGSDTAAQLEAMFQADTEAARPIDLATWRQRPFGQRLDEFFSRLWESML